MGGCQGSKDCSAATAGLKDQPLDFDDVSNEPKVVEQSFEKVAGSRPRGWRPRLLGSPLRGKTSLSLRRGSEAAFADPRETIIVFDWDDTLFPTSYICADVCLDWQFALDWQTLSNKDLETIRAKLDDCQDAAASLLEQAVNRGHVVIVTLASMGWVDTSCANFYPRIGKLLKDLEVPVIYARHHAEAAKIRPAGMNAPESEIERYYGLLKGMCIADVASKFYSSYPGQSWKNILSVGDSRFERYGLFAAINSHITGQDIDTTTSENVASLDPTRLKDVISADGHVTKLRAKCCKFINKPTIEELTFQVGLVSKWLNSLVKFDCGLDLDLDVLLDDSDSRKAKKIEDVLASTAPVESLPKKVGPGSECRILDRRLSGF